MEFACMTFQWVLWCFVHRDVGICRDTGMYIVTQRVREKSAKPSAALAAEPPVVTSAVLCDLVVTVTCRFCRHG